MAQEGVIIGLLVILAGMVSIEIGLSTALLEILVGIIGGNFLALHSATWLDFLSHLGLLGLMFYAGFETDMEVLASNWKQSALVGSASYFAPFLLVMLISKFLLSLSMQASLLLAIALSTTSLAIVYPVLKRRGMLGKEGGQLLLSSAMVVDLLSMFSLTVGFEGASWVTLVFILLIFPSMYLLPRLGRKLFSRYGQNIVEYEVRFLLLMVLALGFGAEAAGVHAAIIAYLSGLFWNELFIEDEKVLAKLHGIIFGFFAPVFFFSAGMAFKIESLTLMHLWLVPLLLLVAVGAKYLGTYFVASRMNLLRKNCKFAAVLFNFRLTFGIVAALIGLESGIISNEFYTAILLVVLLSALLTSFGIRTVPCE